MKGVTVPARMSHQQGYDSSGMGSMGMGNMGMGMGGMGAMGMMPMGYYGETRCLFVCLVIDTLLANSNASLTAGS